VLASREIETLVRRIADRARPKRIILFGSYAEGPTGARSDLDILVIRETDLPIAQRTADVTPIAPDNLSRLTYTCTHRRRYASTPRRNTASDTVLRTGRTVYAGTAPVGRGYGLVDSAARPVVRLAGVLGDTFVFTRHPLCR
jgi:Nucleotidyltransferase domain